LWIVPAKVAGTWNTPSGALTLTQNFQMLSGTLGAQAIQGRLHGNEITMTGRHTEVDRARSTATRSSSRRLRR
jgi:hypothetical protein